MSKIHHEAFENIVATLEKYPERIALIEKSGRTYTYKELKNYITGARSALVKKGVKKGSKVLVFVPMSLELYALLEALFSLGATAIFLDPWMKGKKMGSVIRQVQPELFVVTKRIARLAMFLPSTWKLKKWKFETFAPNEEDWIIEPNIKGTDNALITFTSGTSGEPKGANRTFSFLKAQEQSLQHHLKGEEHIAYIDYTNFPIVGLADLAMGNTVVIPRINLMKIHKSDSLELATHLKDSGAMRLIVSPSLLSKINEGTKEISIETLQHVVTGGAPISNSLIKNCLENHRHISFEAIYGSTEAEPIAMCTFKDVASQFDHPLKGVFVGTPITDIDIKIVRFKQDHIDAQYFRENELTDTEIGEVVVTGSHVNKNYYNNPAAFKKAKIVDDNNTIWHRTGDIGYLENGKLYLVGRDHRIYEKQGTRHYPYPIEQFVELHFGLQDVGYVQKKSGEFIMYIGSGQQVNSTEIREKIVAEGYPCDQVIVWSESLPRDARHKSKLQIEKLI